MILKYDFYKSMLLINRNLTKDMFIEKTGAQKGYSLSMFSKMYDSIFSELIDVEEEFKKYYSFEYETLVHFLYQKHNLKLETIKRIIDAKDKYPNCVLYRKDDFSYGDYGLGQFTFSDTMHDRIINILMLK